MKVTKKRELIIYLVTVILIIIPIIVAFINPSYTTIGKETRGILFFKEDVDKVIHHDGPFNDSGIAPIYAIILYTILLVRNKSNIFNFEDKSGISLKAIILHCLNLVFLTTVFSVLKPDAKILFFNVNCSAFILFGILLSIFGMKSISGFVWIIVAFCLCQTFIAIDNSGKANWIYILCAYASIVSQICLLKLFKFDAREFFADFGIVQRSIKSDITQSAILLKNTVKKGVGTTKKLLNSRNSNK